MGKEQFLKENFLLQSPLAEQLYRGYVADLPVIDYHSHLPPDEILANKNFENITDIWLTGDHYKWRAMRVLGIEEKYITGDADDRSKFQKWAEAVPYTLRNPLFHWTHMELQNPFGINELLNGSSAAGIYEKTLLQLQEPEFSTQGLLNHFKVEMVGTTDDPTDDLNAHQRLSDSPFKTKILPSFRPDKSLNLAGKDDYRAYLEKLASVCGKSIVDMPSLIDCLLQRIDYFHAVGARISDHGLSSLPRQGLLTREEVDIVFKEVIEGNDTGVTPEIASSFAFYILISLCQKYHELDWVQQFHLGALRNNNSRKLEVLGPDTGFDSIGDYQQGLALSEFFNHLDSTDELAKTVIYNLNPADNYLFASMAGNFQDEGIRGKIQFGSGWWFLDQLDGMKDQINTLSNIGLISCFIGMLTDSRSFLSYSRHDYFRRLICDIFANDVLRGVVPNDKEWIGKILADISYFNSKNYFNL